MKKNKEEFDQLCKEVVDFAKPKYQKISEEIEMKFSHLEIKLLQLMIANVAMINVRYNLCIYLAMLPKSKRKKCFQLVVGDLEKYVFDKIKKYHDEKIDAHHP